MNFRPRTFYFLFIFSFSILKTVFSENDTRHSTLRGNGMNFIENRGQVVDGNRQLRPDILYVGEGGGMKIFLRKTGLSYVLTKTEGVEGAEQREKDLLKNGAFSDELKKLKQKEAENATIKGHRIDITFEKCNPNSTIVTDDLVEGNLNYYYAHCPDGITNVPSYNRITYKNIYPNIDVVFYGGKEKGLKYDIIIRPGGDPENIKIKYTGADAISLIDGKLNVKTSIGELNEWMPKIYQNINGQIIDIKSEYQLDGTTLNFRLYNYKNNFPIVIDPWTTYSWSTYYGSTNSELSNDMVADKSENILVTGYTLSSNFPVSVGAYQYNKAGGNGLWDSDAFIVKFDKNGNRLWCTFYGGSDIEQSNALSADKNDNIFVTGITTSADFPVSAAAFQSNNKTYLTVYILKLDANGWRIWATYYGGSSGEFGYGIATDINGNVFITGNTSSGDFPLTPGAFLAWFDPNTPNGFVLKMDGAGNRMWCTLYKGAGPKRIAINSFGDAVIVGYATDDLPVTPGAFQTSSGPITSGFVLTFDGNGKRLWCTFFAGSKTDAITDVAIDSNDNVIIVGETNSPDLPVTAGCNQPTFIPTGFFGMNMNMFICKLNRHGKLLWATYGGEMELCKTCAIDIHNNIYVMGELEDGSGPGTVPTCSSTFRGGRGAEDEVISKYSSDGKQLCYNFWGGISEEDLDGSDGGIVCIGSDVYITTASLGPGYPVNPNAFQTTFSGQHDVVVSKLCGTNCGDPITLENINLMSVGDKASCELVFEHNFNPCDTSGTFYEWTFTGAIQVKRTECNPQGVIYNTPGTYPVKLKVITPCGTDSTNSTITIHPHGPEWELDFAIEAASCNETEIEVKTPNAADYLWNIGKTSAKIIVNESGKYWVTATYDNCSHTDTVSIGDSDILPIPFFPNTFTPNKDGVNDIFKPEGEDVPYFNMKIFNRWGELIYETNDFNKGWDGSYQGTIAKSDVYVWIADTKTFCADEAIIQKRGHITLLR